MSTKRTSPMAQLFTRLSALERSGLKPRTAATRSKRSKASPRSRGGPLRTTKLGDVTEIVYRHVDGSMRHHSFRPRARISYTADGKLLVIDGAPVKAFID